MPKLNFKSYGEGYPIIILHGLFGSLDNWHTFAKQLSKDFMVFTIDQRDHGRSPHTDEFNYEVLAEDVLTFMDEQWIHEAIIIGHSMGGKTAMRLILDNSDRIKKGVIVDIGPQAYPPRHVEIMEAMASVDLDKVNTRSEVEELLSHTIKQKGIRQFLMKNFSRKRSGGFELKINLPLLMNNYDEINIKIDGDPVDTEMLFIDGERSDYLHPSDIEMIRTLFPHAEMYSIAKAGHWIHAEQPQLLLDAIRRFIVE